MGVEDVGVWWVKGFRLDIMLADLKTIHFLGSSRSNTGSLSGLSLGVGTLLARASKEGCKKTQRPLTITGDSLGFWD